MSEQFLIEKRGMYYRPDAKGYTFFKGEAGRYSFEEAAERAGPNGPDGSQDGIGIWRESEAPEYSSACDYITQLQYQKRELVEALKEAVAELKECASGETVIGPYFDDLIAKAEGKSPNNQTDGVASI